MVITERPHIDDKHYIEPETLKKLKQSNRDDIHIISAGPKIRDFDLRSLRGLDVMTLNDAIFYAPVRASYHVFNEPPTKPKEKERYEKLKKRVHLHKFTTFPYSRWHRIYPFKERSYNIAYLLAINIAIIMGYKELHLYGYDFSCDGGYVHWWDKEPHPDKEEIQKKEEFLKKQEEIYLKYVDNLLKSSKDIIIKRY